MPQDYRLSPHPREPSRTAGRGHPRPPPQDPLCDCTYCPTRRSGRRTGCPHRAGLWTRQEGSEYLGRTRVTGVLSLGQCHRPPARPGTQTRQPQFPRPRASPARRQRLLISVTGDTFPRSSTYLPAGTPAPRASAGRPPGIAVRGTPSSEEGAPLAAGVRVVCVLRVCRTGRSCWERGRLPPWQHSRKLRGHLSS